MLIPSSLSGGIMTADDFLAYDVHFKKPMLTSLPGKNLTFVSMRPPSSGALIPFILNVMKGKQYLNVKLDLKLNLKF